MNTLNIDVLYYIGTFLRNSTTFYYAIPYEEDLYKCFGDDDFDAYVNFLIRHKCLKELIKIKKYVDLNNTCINYVIKYFDKRIFKLCLKNINNINYFDSFKCAFYHNNVNAVKQLMKYENLCCLKNAEHFLGVYDYNIKNYNKSMDKGCALNMDAFKYYLCHTVHKDVLEKQVSKLFWRVYEMLEKKVKLKDCFFERLGFIFHTHYFIRYYLFFKNIVHIETLKFRNLFDKYAVCYVELNKFFTFDFTFEHMD